MAYKYVQGTFKPKNISKYRGDVHNITFRSSRELKCMRHFDDHPAVIKWSNEELIIPYRSPLDGEIHRYFPDFVVTMQTPRGQKTVIFEVKPAKQVAEPVKGPKQHKKTFLREVITYGINQAKWQAAEKFCTARGREFRKITEHDLAKL
jgi:hypothetical protein